VCEIVKKKIHTERDINTESVRSL